MVFADCPSTQGVTSLPMRRFMLMRIGLLPLLVALATVSLHAETSHAGKARNNRDAGPGYPGQRATEGASGHAAFPGDETSGRACEKDGRTTKLRALEAKAASSSDRVDGLARQWAEARFRKARNGLKRRPAEHAEAAPARDALAHPNHLCAIVTGAASRARLQPPVRGVIVKGWGEATDAGPATGVSYRAAPGARVVSPCGGRVVFANSFRSYGQLLILDCGGGYHIVLSGLERLSVRSGQAVSAGEPVGLMPLSEPGSTTRPKVLYIELRRNGRPVNPAPWLRNSAEASRGAGRSANPQIPGCRPGAETVKHTLVKTHRYT